MTIRQGGKFTVNTTWNYRTIDLPQGSFRTNLGNMRVTYNFTRLLDDVVRPRQQRRRDGEAERSCSLQVDQQLELARLLHWNFARPGAFRILSTWLAARLTRTSRSGP